MRPSVGAGGESTVWFTATLVAGTRKFAAFAKLNPALVTWPSTWIPRVVEHVPGPQKGPDALKLQRQLVPEVLHETPLSVPAPPVWVTEPEPVAQAYDTVGLTGSKPPLVWVLSPVY